jgi:hypothetical protein
VYEVDKVRETCILKKVYVSLFFGKIDFKGLRDYTIGQLDNLLVHNPFFSVSQGGNNEE